MIFKIPRIFVLKKQNVTLFLFCFFLFLFPKGGIKLCNIPITWGYSLLAFSFFSIFVQRPLIVKKDYFNSIILLIPFWALSLISIAINGTETLSFTISFLISFIFLPFFFFFVFGKKIENIDLNFLLRVIKKGIFFLSIYGIFLFLYKIITGHFLEIPGLTTTYLDSYDLEDKCNLRSITFKLFSTYNNGNIFGICMLMLLPLYRHFEKSLLKKTLFSIVLILTLSRTVWVGMIFFEILNFFFLEKKQSFLKIFIIFASTVLSLFLLAKWLNFNIYFFFDKSLGERSWYFTQINKGQFISTKPFMGIGEPVYLSILINFGIIGLITFLLGILGPLLIFFYKRDFQNILDKCIVVGLITYLFCAIAEGAILYIPTMVFYWFLTAILIKKKLALPRFNLL